MGGSELPRDAENDSEVVDLGVSHKFRLLVGLMGHHPSISALRVATCQDREETVEATLAKRNGKTLQLQLITEMQTQGEDGKMSRVKIRRARVEVMRAPK